MNTLYTFTVPIFVKSLNALKHCIEKAEEHAVDEASLIQSSLAPDMFSFSRQVQIACDNAKGATARLSGTEMPSFADTEATLAELKMRIHNTLSFIESVPESAFEEAKTRQVTLPYFPGKYMTGFDYAREYALPNFFFHVTIAYGLMRKAGVPLGKADFMNGLPLKEISS